MGIVKDLKNINKALEPPERVETDRVKGTWLSLKDGESVKIKFLQELDKESPNYNAEFGQAFLAVEHNHPVNFKAKALCSLDDEGRCFGCELHQRDYKAGWKGKKRFYANVLVDNGHDEPYVAILSQGGGPKAITPTVVEYAIETGSITNVVWKVKRTGSTSTDTSYSVITLPTADIKAPENLELFDLEKSAVRAVPYDEQEAFYLGTASASGSEAPTTHVDEW